MRSESRLDALHFTFNKIILPFFRPETPITSITSDRVSEFIQHHLGRVSNSTIHHYLTDLAAVYNWAINKPKDKRLAEENPVNYADKSPIRNRKFVKVPLDLAKVDQAAELLSGQDRIWFDTARFTGLRKDEVNRMRWEDLNLELGWLNVGETKTPNSKRRIPLADIVVKGLRELKAVSHSEWVFPSQFADTRRRYTYSRDRMFRKIRKAGIKLSAKDLRDYFATIVEGRFEDRLKDVVKTLG